MQLLGPNVVAKYRQELKALKSLGVQAVVVKTGYPLLYQPFLQFNGDPQDYAKIVSFYQGVSNDIHAAGMKMIVECSAIFPGFYSTGSGLNVTGWYSSQQYDGLLNGYAAMNAVIATQIKPDYMNVGGSEPDTEAKNTGFKQFYTPDGWAAAINAFVSQIPPGTGVKIGAGIGTWLIPNGPQFLQNILATTKVDYIDFHIYPVTTPGGSATSIPQNAIDLIDQAQAAGKPVAISEAWLLKQGDATYQQANASTDPTTFSRDAYSFFAPLDQAFLQALWKLSNWKHLVYTSPFWSRYFWSYLDYNQVANLTAAEATAAAEQAAGAALQNGQVSSTGQFYKSLIASSGTQLVSAAGGIGAVAPGSLVTIFGSGLASSTATVTVTDSAGVQQQAATVYVSAAQINAVLPASLATGAATFSVLPAGTTGTFNVVPVAPGIFSTAETLTVHADGTMANGIASLCSGASACVPTPIVVSTPGDTVYLLLFGTGLRNRSSLANTSVSIGMQTVVPSYAGAQGGFAGLDQVNLIIPRSLAGAGVCECFRAGGWYLFERCGNEVAVAKTEPLMSFGMYLLGYLVVVLGLGYGAHLAHMPNQWIAVMVICLVGIGILKAVTSTRQKDPN